MEIRLGDVMPGGPAPIEPDAAAGKSSPLRGMAYAAWGVGAVGFGAFAVVGTLARVDKDRFEEDCSGVTSVPDRVGPGVCLDTTVNQRKSGYQREEVLADVGLITGIVGAAAGTVLFVLSLPSSSSTPSAASSSGLQLGIAPSPGGAWASVSGAF